MQLSKRLSKVVEQVQSGGVVADIGCDHGFTSIYLVKNHICKGALAMDINDGPLLRAREHVREYGLQDKIQIRKSDGTENLLPNEADTLLISGMGGGLMERILLRKPEVINELKEMVLSPQSEIYKVRQCVHKMGFRIDYEEMVFDMGKYYTIIHCIPGVERYEKEIDYVYGKQLINRKDKILFEFLEKELQRVQSILHKLPKEHARRQELEKEYQDIQCILQNYAE